MRASYVRFLSFRIRVWGVLICFSWIAAAQNASVSSRYSPSQTQVRESHFLRGRSRLAESAAALRYHAIQQKLQMRQKARQKISRESTIPQNFWTPLGPMPLASDASGVGRQDYNWVSGRATSVAIDGADPSGNTVYLGGASGGVWKSTNAGPLS